MPIVAEVIGRVLAMAVHEGSALCRVSSDSQWQEAKSHSGISRLVAVWKLTLPHQFKIFRTKGAVLILFWGFSAFNFMTSSPNCRTVLTLRDKAISPVLVFTMCMLLYPILGWLGDVKCGRYRVIKWWVVDNVGDVHSLVSCVSHFDLFLPANITR